MSLISQKKKMCKKRARGRYHIFSETKKKNNNVANDMKSMKVIWKVWKNVSEKNIDSKDVKLIFYFG